MNFLGNGVRYLAKLHITEKVITENIKWHTLIHTYNENGLYTFSIAKPFRLRGSNNFHPIMAKFATLFEVEGKCEDIFCIQGVLKIKLCLGGCSGGAVGSIISILYSCIGQASGQASIWSLRLESI